MPTKHPVFVCGLIMLLSAISGCIEHTFNISVLPEGGVDIVYHAEGDIMDFNDEGQLMPDSTVWNLRIWDEKRDDKEVHHVEAVLHLDNLSDMDTILNWQQSPDDTLHLRNNFTLKRIHRLFGVTYQFTGILYSRRFNATYGDVWNYVPSECQLLEDQEKMDVLSSTEIEILEEKFALGVIQWNIARFTNRFDKVWKLASAHQPNLTDTSETILSIARAGWVEDLHQYMNNLDIERAATLNLNWWTDLRPVFLGRLIDITGPNSADLFGRIGDSIEREYQISKDVEDDIYRFVVDLPGRKSSHNGEVHDNGKIAWEFSGKGLLNEDGIMTAKSFEISIMRTVMAALLVVIIFSLVRRLIRRRGSGFISGEQVSSWD